MNAVRATLTFYPFPQVQPRGGAQLLLITTSKVFWKGDLYRGEQWRIDGDPGWNGKQYEHAIKNLSDVIFWAELPDAVELANAALGNRTPARQEADALHAAIMNLPCSPPPGEAIWRNFYRQGHRDARHAAAELVAAFASSERGHHAAALSNPARRGQDGEVNSSGTLQNLQALDRSR